MTVSNATLPDLVQSGLVLEPKVQNYHWGKRGRDSLVAQLAGQSDQTKTYAELWMGAHASAPSSILLGGKSIAFDQAIAQQPELLLGKRAYAQFGAKLPFLFKVLSIGKALSIQAHPNKTLAAVLHKRDPKNYPDDNHKPEIAIALTELWILNGFKTLKDLFQTISRFPELKLCLETKYETLLTAAKGDSQNEPEIIKAVFSELMHCPTEQVEIATRSLQQRLSLKSRDREDDFLCEFISDYGVGDVGILGSLFLQLHKLEPGEAVFIGSNIPHAYLHGDIIECMANSDNVVRAGLTPKFKDVPTLLEMLDYQPKQFTPIRVEKRAQGQAWTRYAVPVQEFQIDCLSGSHDLMIKDNQYLRMILCLDGQAIFQSAAQRVELVKGSVLVIPAALESYALRTTQAQLFRVSLEA